MGDSAADVDGHPQEGGALQTAKDLFAGAAGGIAQVLTGECDQFLVLEVEGGRGGCLKVLPAS